MSQQIYHDLWLKIAFYLIQIFNWTVASSIAKTATRLLSNLSTE